MFSLAEEIFLLSLLEKKDSLRLPPSMSLPFSLTAATLIDLVLLEYVRLEDGRLIALAEPAQIEDETMNHVIQKMRMVERHKKADHWVYVLGAKGQRFARAIIQSLIAKGILTEAGKFFNWAPLPADANPPQFPYKYLLKREIRDAVFGETRLEERLVAKLVMMDSCDMLDHLFTTDELIGVRKKMKSMKTSAAYAPAFLDLIQHIEEAVDFAIASAITR